MKRFIYAIIFVILVAGTSALIAGCAHEKTELPNPVHSTDAAGLCEATGIQLEAPEGAADVCYGYIEGEGTLIAQVNFSLNGIAYTYRASSTAETAFFEGADISDPTAISEAADAAVGKGAELAGLYYDKWKGTAVVDIGYCEGVYACASDELSFAAWIDVVPGIMYSLTADGKAAQEELLSVAETVFVPMQGEAD